MIKTLLSVIFVACLLDAALASSVAYEIFHFTKDKNGQLVAEGNKEYSYGDIKVSCDENHCRKTLLLERGYGVGASVYREPRLKGFGIWATRNNEGFSWEWFGRDGEDKFKKLQEGGMVTVKYQGLPVLEEIAEIRFDTDVYLRLDESHSSDGDTQRILIKKDSILKFVP